VTVHSLAHRHVHIVGDDAKVELVQQLGMSEKNTKFTKVKL
jgi:hypothetical protein